MIGGRWKSVQGCKVFVGPFLGEDGRAEVSHSGRHWNLDRSSFAYSKFHGREDRRIVGETEFRTVLALEMKADRVADIESQFIQSGSLRDHGSIEALGTTGVRLWLCALGSFASSVVRQLAAKLSTYNAMASLTLCSVSSRVSLCM